MTKFSTFGKKLQRRKKVNKVKTIFQRFGTVFLAIFVLAAATVSFFAYADNPADLVITCDNVSISGNTWTFSGTWHAYNFGGQSNQYDAAVFSPTEIVKDSSSKDTPDTFVISNPPGVTDYISGPGNKEDMEGTWSNSIEFNSVPAEIFATLYHERVPGNERSGDATCSFDLPQCSDGIDNDNDGSIDYQTDLGCTDANDNDETDPLPPPPQCSDGIDNDNDGKTDFPTDLGCSDANDNDESNDPTPPEECDEGFVLEGDECVPEETEDPEQCELTIVSGDGNETVVETNLPALLTYDLNSEWNVVIDGARWIWKSLQVENPTQDETYTFKETFNWTGGDIESATLTLNADNSFKAWLNSIQVAFDDTEFNYKQANQTSVDVSSQITSGENEIQVEVKNWALENGTYLTNPAGTIYRLEITGDCEAPEVEDEDPPVSHFNDDLDHETINSLEDLPILFSGFSTDDISGVASAVLKIFLMGDEELVDDEEEYGAFFETLDCEDQGTPISSETINLSLSGVGLLNSPWSYSWTPTTRGIYCVEAHATDVAGNVEHTAFAGPISILANLNPTPPSPTPTPNPTPPPAGGPNPTPPPAGGPTPTPPPPSSGGGGGGPLGSFGGGPLNFGGSVLGASTNQGEVLGDEIACGLYISDFIHLRKKNNSEQVKKLQDFLNQHMSAGLPVSGTFGPMTFKAVKKFQEVYADEVLAPWGKTDSTGYVYKTTRRKINMIVCPNLGLPIPQFLVPDTNVYDNE